MIFFEMAVSALLSDMVSRLLCCYVNHGRLHYNTVHTVDAVNFLEEDSLKNMLSNISVLNVDPLFRLVPYYGYTAILYCECVVPCIVINTVINREN